MFHSMQLQGGKRADDIEDMWRLSNIDSAPGRRAISLGEAVLTMARKSTDA
ncbi:hypothetical protein SAMN05444064_107216 [Pseudomonas syringae]|nr:hypothetical protein ALQ52_200032 [Pseudomonas cannabina pv. alisalensis]RMP21942.1 hypothetical protein ALQ25_00621 [Pseudomonas coronafaciens pv. atropurpurea]SDW79231.1 hypothetical protein SAMN05444514_10723 [Pseudomonas syringae]SFM01630.1 hypothetical protein SAMN05444064_107216 [Pseudomonas syringae]